MGRGTQRLLSALPSSAQPDTRRTGGTWEYSCRLEAPPKLQGDRAWDMVTILFFSDGKKLFGVVL